MSAGLLAMTGCSKGSSGVKLPTEQDYVGTWIEVRESGGMGGRIAPPPELTPNLRKLSVNADKTFKMEMVTPAGQPISPPEVVEGTWTLKSGAVDMTVTKNTLKAAYKQWAPRQIASIQDEGGQPTIFTIHEDESPGKFRRQ